MSCIPKGPPGGDRGGPSEDVSFATEHFDTAKKSAPAQDVSRDHLREDIQANTGILIAQLEVALAAIAVPDDCGLLYSLRRGRCYWRAIAMAARDLADSREREARS